MIRTRCKKVLLVSSKAFPHQLFADYKNVKHISAATAIFPSIHEMKPDAILFDHQHLGDQLERVLRRLQTNTFYRNIKIYCYKQTESVKADALLKVLGVHQMIYHDDLHKSPKGNAAFNTLSTIIDASLLKWVVNAAH